MAMVPTAAPNAAPTAAPALSADAPADVPDGTGSAPRRRVGEVGRAVGPSRACGVSPLEDGRARRQLPQTSNP